MIKTLPLLVALAVALAVPTVAQADAVTDWNATAADILMTRAGQGPQAAVPHMAMIHGAIYDGVNALDWGPEGYEGYLLRSNRATPFASKEAATAAAARRVLVSILSDGPAPPRPDLVPLVEAQYALSLALIPDGPAKTKGIASGNAAAQAMIANRTGDGRYGPYRFPVGSGPGAWVPVLPAFVNDPNAWLKDVKPFLVKSGTQFLGRGPQPLTSPKYTQEFNEVKLIGGETSALRTADQTHAARYWAENPPRTWSRIARTVALQEGTTLDENARMFAMAYMTAADALITVWNDRAKHLFWRPITAIREADSDGNPDTVKDPNWLPLIPTPPYPEHSSGHAGLTSGFTSALASVLGDDTRWTDTNAGGLTRSFLRFSQAVQEVVDARVWSGIHFRTADEVAAQIGPAIGEYRDQHYFRPVGWRGR
jgi:hypothetical protein